MEQIDQGNGLSPRHFCKSEKVKKEQRVLCREMHCV